MQFQANMKHSFLFPNLVRVCAATIAGSGVGVSSASAGDAHSAICARTANAAPTEDAVCDHAQGTEGTAASGFQQP